MTRANCERIANEVGMKPGHAMKFVQLMMEREKMVSEREKMV